MGIELDKRRLHHLWATVKPVKVWYLLALTIVCGTVYVICARSNNLTMVSLREQVYVADKNNTDVEGALQGLRSFVHGHMNTELESGEHGVYPPIQLKYTYQRLTETEQARVQQANAQVYTDAQAYCEKLYPGSFSGGPRVPCIEQYVSERGVKANSIPDALYKFDFASPTWSPDLAGFSLIAALLLALATILRIGLSLLVKQLRI